MTRIQRGDEVEVIAADGRVHRMRAVSGPEMGRDFVVVWVCQTNADADAIPWPAEAVRLVASQTEGSPVCLQAVPQPPR